MNLFAALNQSGTLRPIDHALAHSLKRLDPATPDDVLAAAALASLAIAHGHSGFNLAEPEQLVASPLPWPSPLIWGEQLAGSPWVAQPESSETAKPAPLVLEHGLLYLRRYREYEYQLAADLHRIGNASLLEKPLSLRERGWGEGTAKAVDSGIKRPGGLTTKTHLFPLFTQLFPPDTADQHQAQAATVALESPLLLLTGGPGTGKTTTIARLLVLRVAQRLAQGQPVPRIALAAPTGRAAERMAESLR